MESAGAFYHVLNRGDYRQELFTVGQSGQQSEETLFEACGLSQGDTHWSAPASNTTSPPTMVISARRSLTSAGAMV